MVEDDNEDYVPVVDEDNEGSKDEYSRGRKGIIRWRYDNGIHWHHQEPEEEEVEGEKEVEVEGEEGEEGKEEQEDNLISGIESIMSVTLTPCGPILMEPSRICDSASSKGSADEVGMLAAPATPGGVPVLDGLCDLAVERILAADESD